MIHQAVLPQEVLTYLDPKPGQTIVDATLGAGGHTGALLAKGARVIAFDRDALAIETAEKKFAREIADTTLTLVHAPFSGLTKELQRLNGQAGAGAAIDGVLIDAGVSSDQLLSQTRGFSFSSSAPLDMRMDPREEQTAASILATWSEQELRDLFFSVEERSAKKIAQAIVAARVGSPIERTDQLTTLIESVSGSTRRGPVGRGVHPATKVFLALRMAVNHELEELTAGLDSAMTALKSGGRLVVISFHSGEDRLVKNQMRDWTKGCICAPELPICQCGHDPVVRLLTKKPITPTPQERARNPRARSAKLRACQKL